jgi:hypothetical protein
MESCCNQEILYLGSQESPGQKDSSVRLDICLVKAVVAIRLFYRWDY